MYSPPPPHFIKPTSLLSSAKPSAVIGETFEVWKLEIPLHCRDNFLWIAKKTSCEIHSEKHKLQVEVVEVGRSICIQITVFDWGKKNEYSSSYDHVPKIKRVKNIC